MLSLFVLQSYAFMHGPIATRTNSSLVLNISVTFLFCKVIDSNLIIYHLYLFKKILTRLLGDKKIKIPSKYEYNELLDIISYCCCQLVKYSDNICRLSNLYFRIFCLFIWFIDRFCILVQIHHGRNYHWHRKRLNFVLFKA